MAASSGTPQQHISGPLLLQRMKAQAIQKARQSAYKRVLYKLAGNDKDKFRDLQVCLNQQQVSQYSFGASAALGYGRKKRKRGRKSNSKSRITLIRRQNDSNAS